jgi:acetyl esterase
MLKPKRGDMRKVIYKKTEQGELGLHIYEPVTDGVNRPGVVFYFGGGWNKGNMDQFKTHSEHLAAQGMVCVCAEYRVKSKHNTTPIECVEDGRSAFRWVKSHADELGIDTNRLAAGGGSSGGHVALCVSLADTINSPEDDLSIDCKPSLLLLFNPAVDFVSRPGTLDESQARSISPIHLIEAELQPSIMFYGSKDAMIAEGKALQEKSRSIEVDSELNVAEGEKHAFFNRSPWKETCIHLMHGFLERHRYVEGPSEIPVESEMHELETV